MCADFSPNLRRALKAKKQVTIIFKNPHTPVRRGNQINKDSHKIVRRSKWR